MSNPTAPVDPATAPDPVIAKSGRSFDFAGYRFRLEAGHGDDRVPAAVDYVVRMIKLGRHLDVAMHNGDTVLLPPDPALYRYLASTPNSGDIELALHQPLNRGDQIVVDDDLLAVAMIRHNATGGPADAFLIHEPGRTMHAAARLVKETR